MKLDLKALEHLYNYLKNNDKLESDITSFEDFIGYAIALIIDNIEYDYGVYFSEYVDLNQFIEEEN